MSFAVDQGNGGLAVADRRGKIDKTRLAFHSDQGAVDLIALLSLGAAPQGGESKWVSAIAIHNELLRCGRQVGPFKPQNNSSNSHDEVSIRQPISHAVIISKPISHEINISRRCSLLLTLAKPFSLYAQQLLAMKQ